VLGGSSALFGPWGDVLPGPLAPRLHQSPRLLGLRRRQRWAMGSVLVGGCESGEAAVSAGYREVTLLQP